MGKVINVVVDASGSMAEDDKNAVVKYLINGICNVKQEALYRDTQFVLFQWNSASVKFDDMEKAKIEFRGRSSFEDLESIIDEIDSDSSIILISDGGFGNNEKNKIRNLSKKIIPIFVGIDANRTILKDISTNNIVYSVADFMQALNEARF